MTSKVVAGRYRLEEQIASGVMAEVWAADDIELGRRVALKLLARNADPARFAREARAAAGLSHPCIGQVYDYGETDGRPYIVLEYLAGGSLEDRLAAGQPLSDDETQRIAGDLAAGLAHAHARGVVHRDVKPANVLFDQEGNAKITDFGIARIEAMTTLTDPGTLIGTASYMSPEQARGERATPASDVYSFGVILYRMLSGRLPFEAGHPLELAELHEKHAPPPLGSLRADVPPDLERVARAALAKRPEERPSDGSALLAALGGAPSLEEPPTVLLPPGADADAARSRRTAFRPRARTLAAGAALAVLAAAGAAVALLATPDRSQAPVKERTREPSSPRSDRATTQVATAGGGSEATTDTRTRTGTKGDRPRARPGPPASAPGTTTATTPTAPTITTTPETTTAETTTAPQTTTAVTETTATETPTVTTTPP
ncbi:MAG: serine/threonine protein kinase [Thermoleophilia bacterium]|nr:serine/threonine protein kinase [Thermoleophilia bacterium]